MGIKQRLVRKLNQNSATDTLSDYWQNFIACLFVQSSYKCALKFQAFIRSDEHTTYHIHTEKYVVYLG